ncbi:MAG: hypothetical protein ACQEWL_17840 [Pseudomonadota bacterium]
MISNLTWQLIKSALKQYQGAIIGGLIAVLCGGAIGWFVHERISQKVIHGLNAELRQKDRAIVRYETERRDAAERHVAALQEVIKKLTAEQQRTQHLEKSLHQTQAQLSQTQQQLKGRIDEAVQRDGHTECFGAHSLQLYNDALGY